MARARLTKARLLGLDRSGPPPPETRRGAPLNPWTLPNAIGFVRLGLLPVFLVLAFESGDGRSLTAAIIYAVVGGTDYLDGIAARLTGQYSRLGALLDPLTDRVLVASGAIVCWHFELLPRWALLVLAGRDGLYIDDLGSLNGTYVNRRRIESHKLVDGDELQIGKYKLTYLA